MNLSLRVEDAAARAAMNKFPGKFERALRGTINDVSALTVREAQTQPGQRPGSTYVRTGTLMRSWNESEVQGSGTQLWAEVGSDGNIAPYNRWVQDEERQVPIHAALWRTLQGIVRDNNSRYSGMLEARVGAEM